MSSTSESEFKYSFLKVRKDKDSILMGINPTNKYQHELIKLVKQQNSIQHAIKGMLFNLNNSNLEQLQLDQKTAITNLNSLVTNLFMAQVYAFEYDAHNRTLKVNSYFITHPGEDKSYNIYNIFDEILSFSFNSIKSWFDNREQIPAENFKKELQVQFQQKVVDTKSQSVLLNTYRKFQEFKTGIIVADEMLEYISKELNKRLIEAGIAKEIPGHGLLLLKNSEILEHFEICAEFLNERIIPNVSTEPIQKSRLDKVSLEEKIYFSTEKYIVKTAKFTALKAKEIKQAKASKTNLYPGALCIESIIKLEDITEEKYQSQWKEECNKVKQEFKRTITVPSNKWFKLITFVSDEESKNYHPDVWKDLINDKDLLYLRWNLPKTIMHVFTGNQPGFFKVLVPGMMSLSLNEIWKASALKSLMEKNQKQLRGLMADSSFTVIFQNLEKRIYMSYLPWYYKIFFFFPFVVFLEPILFSARKKIHLEQEAYSNKHDEVAKKIQSDQKTQYLNKVNSIKDEFIYESIIQTLDNYYFNLKKIPSVNEIKQFFEDYEAFSNIVNLKKFRIIPIIIKNNEDDALLYPEDAEWKTKKSQLSKVLDSIIHEKNPHLVSQNPDKVRLEKAQKLLNLIETNSLPKVKAV
jgi:hypothetical protein